MIVYNRFGASLMIHEALFCTKKPAPLREPAHAVLVQELLLLGSTDGAGAGTSAALYAQIGVDLELTITLGDSTDGTFCRASAACDASISDFESHC